jgi:hypothetical protein
MIVIPEADLRVLERSTNLVGRGGRGIHGSAILPSIKNRALDGQACLFDVAFAYGNDVILLKPNCFGDLTNKRVGFRLDHIDSAELASTDDGALALMGDDKRIQFRVLLEKCKHGSVIARMCEIDSRSAVSIGCDITREHKETIAGHSVRVVTRAVLKEVSVVKEGAAGDNAFAVLVDTTATPKPVAGQRSATLETGQILHRISRKVKALKASIAATYGTSEQPKPMPRRPMTMDQFIRLHSQSDETERLQALARSRLLLLS